MITEVEAEHAAWQRALKSDDTDEWHFTATALAERIPELLAALKEARAERDDALRMVLALTGTGSCRFGIHGECQEHGWLADGGCPKVRAESILEGVGGDVPVESADLRADRPSPFELWQLAKGNRVEYRRLLREHGHLVERQPGDDLNLPCGWPGTPGVEHV